MCSAQACPRSPLRLSRHGTWCIQYRWRHADWPSTGHKSPCGRWHRCPRPESADASHAWLVPAEHWQGGWQSPKREKQQGETEQARTETIHGNISRLVPKYRTGNGRRSVIHITSHRNAICPLAAGPIQPLPMRSRTVQLEWNQKNPSSAPPPIVLPCRIINREGVEPDTQQPRVT